MKTPKTLSPEWTARITCALPVIAELAGLTSGDAAVAEVETRKDGGGVRITLTGPKARVVLSIEDDVQDGVFGAAAPLNPYVDPAFTERPCDQCGKPYRGPAVFCSLACAEAAA